MVKARFINSSHNKPRHSGPPAPAMLASSCARVGRYA